MAKSFKEQEEENERTGGSSRQPAEEPRVTSEDQIGRGGAKSATKKVESRRKRNRELLEKIRRSGR